MAAPTKFTCIVHFEANSGSKISNLTEISWNTIRETAKTWATFETEQDSVRIAKTGTETGLWDLTLSEVLKKKCGGYHRYCYSRFTNKQNIERVRAKRSREHDDAEDADDDEPVPKSSRRVSRKGRDTKTPGRSNILARQCIICNKVDHFYRRSRKKIRDQLMLAETEDGGKPKLLYFQPTIDYRK